MSNNKNQGFAFGTERSQRMVRVLRRIKKDPNYGRLLMGLPPLPQKGGSDAPEGTGNQGGGA